MEVDADRDLVLPVSLAFIADNGREDRGIVASVPGLPLEI
jgi:hypothetical protein